MIEMLEKWYFWFGEKKDSILILVQQWVSLLYGFVLKCVFNNQKGLVEIMNINIIYWMA